MVHRTFPFRLHAILDQAYDLDVHGESRIISWTPSGKSFKIHNIEAFTTHILPKYFPKQSQYKSFKRQLQYYGFSNFGWEHFGHPFFLRRQRELVTHLRHKKSSRRAQDVAEHSCPPPSADPLEVILKKNEANKVSNSLLKLVEQVPPATLSCVAPPAANPMKLQSDLFSLAPTPTPSIHTRLNEQRLLDLLLAASLPPSLTPRLQGIQASDLLMFNKQQQQQQQQQSDAQDLLCRSNRLVELQLRLALANTSQVPNRFL